jgi:hypothetical protein
VSPLTGDRELEAILPLSSGGSVANLSLLVEWTGRRSSVQPVPLDDDVGMWLEQAYQLLAGRHCLTVQDAPLALGEDALDQRQIVAEAGAPTLGRDPGEVGQLFAGLLQRRLGSAGGGSPRACS